MISRARARALRAMMERAAASLSDGDALDAPELYPVWESGRAYSIGYRLRHGDKLYKVLQPHTSQDDWTPDAVPALYAEVLIPDPEVIPDWVQPDSTNPYMRGDKVRHNGAVWVSDVDGNVWEPGVYGWREVTA